MTSHGPPKGERGFGRIFRRKTAAGEEYGNWIIAYSWRNREYRETTKSTNRTVARDLLKKRFSEMEQGRFAGPAGQRATVDELLDDLVVDYRIRGLASLRTVDAHRRSLLDHLRGVRAIDVTTARLNRIVAAWQEDKDAPATINKRMTSLRRAFNLGRKATPPKVAIVPDFPRLPEDNAREGFFDKAELFAVLTHLERDPALHDFVEWAFWTGMRKGEIAKLEWSNVDRETGTLTLPGRITKNRRPRKLVLTGPLRAIVERRWEARRARAKEIGRLETLVFWRLYDEQPREGLRPGDAVAIVEFRKAWATATTAAGCPGRLFHDLRRTGVRNLRRAGVDRRVAMLISGHRTENVFERYNIDSDEDLRVAMERVSAYVDKLPGASRTRALHRR